MEKKFSCCSGTAIQNSFTQGQSRMTCKVLSRFRHRRHSEPIPCWWWAIKERVGNLLWVHFHIKIWIFCGRGVFQIQFHLLLSKWIISCMYMKLDASFTVHWPLIWPNQFVWLDMVLCQRSTSNKFINFVRQ